MTKKSKLTNQSPKRSWFYGQLAYAEGLPGVADMDPRMTNVLLETAPDHTEMMLHVREWRKGWDAAMVIENAMHFDERLVDQRKPLRPEPRHEHQPQPQPFRFKRHR